MSNYVTIHEEYRHKFFQIPKVFFTNEKYKKISNNAKVAWAILRDRSALSRKNKWFDTDTGRIYFIFTNVELKEILNIGSNTTLSNIKKELEKAELIESVRQGLNKPNKMYLLYPEITESDMYEIDNLENYEHKPVEVLKNEENEEESYPQAQSQSGQGRTETGRPESVRPDVQKVYANDTDLSNTDLKDLDTLDTEPDFSITNNNNSNASEKERYLIESFFENDIVPVNIAKCLKTFSTTLEEAEHFSQLIFRAKKAVETELDIVIWLDNDEEVERIIINSFTRALRKVNKTTVKNPDGYIYKSIEGGLSKHFSEMLRQSQYQEVSNEERTGGKVPFYNWLEERD